MRRLTLSRRLLIGFAATGLLVGALVIVGDDVITDAARRQEETLTSQVQPLARLNRLQSQINAIRVLEVEMPRLIDLFAVANQVEMLGAERGEVFERDLAEFLRGPRAGDDEQAARLAEYWKRYQADLEAVTRHARLMELDAAQRIATFESAGRFKAISRTLKQLAEATEARARAAFTAAEREHDRQRNAFILTSAVGLVVLAVWFGLLARSVTGRLSRLRDAATGVAEGETERRVDVGGSDELTDLGAAFTAMQEKVRAREQALRASHDELEARVAGRTSELHNANDKLVAEIEQRRRIEERLHFQAQYDSLTELPNRILAMDRLAQAIAAAKRSSTHVVLVFLDLDGFKAVNDTYGHQAGDALLVQAARRLRRAVREGDTVARLGGDEFLVVMGGLATPEPAKVIADGIVGAFSPPFDIGQAEVLVSTSVGLAVYPADGEEAGTLLRSADLAMYAAKEAGRNTYRFFDRQSHGGSVRLSAIERDLRTALARGELRLAWQPLFTTAGRALYAAEALLRWDSREHGAVPPDEFVPAAERTGLITEIGEWVLRTACAQASAWRAEGWKDLRIAVNVSPRQFRGERLATVIRECLATNALPADTLQLEVTEGLLMRNQTEVLAMLESIGKLGVRLSMDDFGTGYSSLSYLKRFPFHALKIDREFVDGLATDMGDRQLVIAAIRMGKGLGLAVTAEGVETDEQLEILAAHECDVVQGYLLGRPVPAAEFSARWIRSATLV